jgi:hypothetical protein
MELALISLGVIIGMATFALVALIYLGKHAAARRQDDMHFGIFQTLKVMRGNIQFLMANNIAEELEKARARTKAAPAEDTQ